MKMYQFMHELLSDKKSGVFTFKAFSFCHLLYLAIIIGGIALTIYLYKNKSQEQKVKVIDYTVIFALGLYICDFFLMPFSYGYIDIDKLPFHLCTSMSIMCLLARRTKVFAKFKTSFSVMGLIGALMYLSYPAGVSEADGYSYRIIQTVIYHGFMLAQGIFAIAFKDLELGTKNLKYDFITVSCLVVWAFLGNSLYSGVLTEVCECVENCPHVINVYEHDFNWFFVKHDALYIISDEIDVYFAPFVMLGIIFVLSAIIRFIGIKLHSFLEKKSEQVRA